MGSPTVPRTFRDSRLDLWGRSSRFHLHPTTHPGNVCGSAASSLLHWLAAVLHQHPDGGRRRVELGHLIFVHHLPHATDVRVGRQALELKGRHTSNKFLPRNNSNQEKCTSSSCFTGLLLPSGGKSGVLHTESENKQTVTMTTPQQPPFPVMETMLVFLI